MAHNQSGVQEQETSSAKRPNNCLLEGSVVGFVSLLMGCIGVAVPVRLFTGYEIPWQRYALPSSPRGTTEISGVTFHSYLDQPAGDTVYVRTAEGAVYSNTLFEETWKTAGASDGEAANHASQCSPVWSETPSDAPIWDAPPVEEQVLDSAGVRFEHSMAIAVRCYVLFEDGSIQLWTRYDDFRSSSALLIGAPLLGAFGAVAGLIIGVLIVRAMRRKNGRPAGP